MEANNALTADQLDKLKTMVRQRFDDLYHRIGTSRQKLANTVLLVDQSINKELTKEKIDAVREKKIINRLREIEREANNQLPHVHKVVSPSPTVVKAPAMTPSVKTPSAKTPAAKTPPAKTPAAKTPAAKTPVKTASKAKAAPKAKAKKK